MEQNITLERFYALQYLVDSINQENDLKIQRIAAYVYAALSVIVITFQLALALGAPWGEYAMGGAYPGQMPPALRLAALVQAALLFLLAAVILSRAGVAFTGWKSLSRWLAWLAVVFSGTSLLLNLATPSANERLLWAPVAFLMLVSSLVVATRSNSVG